MKCFAASGESFTKRGFALVSIVSIVALLALLVLAISSLATRETGSVDMDLHRDLARANARLD